VGAGIRAEDGLGLLLEEPAEPGHILVQLAEDQERAVPRQLRGLRQRGREATALILVAEQELAGLEICPRPTSSRRALTGEGGNACALDRRLSKPVAVAEVLAATVRLEGRGRQGVNLDDACLEPCLYFRHPVGHSLFRPAVDSEQAVDGRIPRA